MAPTPTSWILAEDYAGLQAQALGLAEAAGLAPEIRTLRPRPPWSWFPARLWPRALDGVQAGELEPPWPALVISCGGTAAAVAAMDPNRLFSRFNGHRLDFVNNDPVWWARFGRGVAQRIADNLMNA